MRLPRTVAVTLFVTLTTFVAAGCSDDGNANQGPTPPVADHPSDASDVFLDGHDGCCSNDTAADAFDAPPAQGVVPDSAEPQPASCSLPEEDSPSWGWECTTISGDVQITAADDLERLTGDRRCLDVEGNLRIEDTVGLEALASPWLIQQVTGSLIIRNNQSLTSLDANRLIVGDDVIIEDNAALTFVALDQREPIGGELAVRNNQRLSILSARKLHGTGAGFDVVANPSLSSIEFVQLRHVGGTYRIDDNPMLTRLVHPLLTRVVGDIQITQNTDLEALEINLPFLDYVGADLTITDNPGLPHCEIDTAQALMKPTAVVGDIVVRRNDRQATCTGTYTRPGSIVVTEQHDIDLLGQLGITTIDGRLHIEGDHLAHVDGLSSLRRVEGGVFVNGTTRLENLNGLSQLEYAPNIYITNNSALRTIDGFASVGPLYWLEITNNDALERFDGFAEMESTGHVFIEGNDALRHLPGFDALKRAKTLVIGDNDALVDLEGLDNLEEIYGGCNSADPGGQFGIYGNDSLVSLDGLERLSSVRTSLSISSNPRLADLTALRALRNTGGCRYGGYGLTLANNDALKSLEGLDFDSPSALKIYDNNALVDLRGLESVEEITFLWIANNSSLETLQGLDHMRRVGFDDPTGALVLADNEGLVSIDALLHLEAVGDLRIVRNPSLATCQVQQVGAVLAPDNLLSFTYFCNDTTQVCR